MRTDLALSRDHFADDPFLLGVFDDIAQLAYIGKEIRAQWKTFKNAKVATKEQRDEVRDTIADLAAVASQLVLLLFSTNPKGARKAKVLKEVREKSSAVLGLASIRAGQLAVLEKQHYEGTAAPGNAFRSIQFRLDALRQQWAPRSK